MATQAQTNGTLALEQKNRVIIIFSMHIWRAQTRRKYAITSTSSREVTANGCVEKLITY